MTCNRKLVRVTKFLFAGVTVFCVSWIACVNEWHGGVKWRVRGRRGAESQSSTMRTIVAYSEGKLAELERPSPVTCDQLPAYPDIPYINRTWHPGDSARSSWQRVASTRVSLYAAYYDERSSQRYVRILASFQGRNFSVEETLFCQTRAMNTLDVSVEVVAAKPLEIWWFGWDVVSRDVETPLLLSCPLTEPLYSPSVISVVTQPCDDPGNAFLLEPVQQKQIYDRTFTVCVKDLNFNNDISQKLREWIETNRILGVDMIDIYVDTISEENEKVLLYYQSKGYVRLFTVPAKNNEETSLWQKRRNHVITYNDCLYRNIRESEYIVPLDIDEIVLPKVANTFQEMLVRLSEYGWNPDKHSAVLVRNVFFFDFIQGVTNYSNTNTSESEMYVKRDDVRINSGNLNITKIDNVDNNNIISKEVIDLRNINKKLYDEYKMRCGNDLETPKLARSIVRSAVVSPTGHYSKSFMVTKKVLTAFNHYPLVSVGATGFAIWTAPFNEVQLNHYKEHCNTTVVGECERYRHRTRIDRSALRLEDALLRALARLPCDIVNRN